MTLFELRFSQGICPVVGLLGVRWMDLESVIQSEVSQNEKNKYHMLTHIYGTKKKKKSGYEEPSGRTGIKTQT